MTPDNQKRNKGHQSSLVLNTWRAAEVSEFQKEKLPKKLVKWRIAAQDEFRLHTDHQELEGTLVVRFAQNRRVDGVGVV